MGFIVYKYENNVYSINMEKIVGVDLIVDEDKKIAKIEIETHDSILTILLQDKIHMAEKIYYKILDVIVRYKDTKSVINLNKIIQSFF